MNKFVIVLFGVVLISTLGIGIDYFTQTKNIPFLFPTQVDKLATFVSTKCKDTGFSTLEEAEPYIGYLLPKTSWRQNSEKEFESIFHIGSNCWPN
jgi:hypothetical protein